MILTSPAQILDFSPYEIRTEAEATHNIGELIWTGDGRAFRHATAGEALAAGYLTTEPTGNTSLTNSSVYPSERGLVRHSGLPEWMPWSAVQPLPSTLTDPSR